MRVSRTRLQLLVWKEAKRSPSTTAVCYTPRPRGDATLAQASLAFDFVDLRDFELESWPHTLEDLRL
jgi:hypothetical protein